MEVIFIQESRLLEEELRVIEISFANKGFYLYKCNGDMHSDGTGQDAPSGGVLIAVDKTMKQRQLQEENKVDVQMLAVTMQNWQIVNMLSLSS